MSAPPFPMPTLSSLSLIRQSGTKNPNRPWKPTRETAFSTPSRCTSERRDFRGIPDRGFDGRGNFTLGIKEHTIFPEMEADRVENPKGMNITIVTSATTDKEGKFLLDQLGMPFRK